MHDGPWAAKTADFLAALADALSLLGRGRQRCDSARGRGTGPRKFKRSEAMFIVLKGTDGREMQVNTRHVTKVMPIGKSNLTWVFLSDGTKEKIKETYEKVSKQIVDADH